MASDPHADKDNAPIYAGTLLPMSVYAFARGLSAITFAPAIGQYIDIGSRLQVVRLSINTQFLLFIWFISANSVPSVVQRLVVVASCVSFYLLTIRVLLGHGEKTGILVLLAFLVCIEKLCSMNLVSVEKDWVVVARCSSPSLTAPPPKMAIIVNSAMNVASVLLEYFAIARVCYGAPELQEPKKMPHLEQPDRI
ncbi:hypothetical protein K432DRAFT_462387 [Lepidopterella palustris CBS 459.81]|uniref:Solute carrier family 40 member n=1 Tax=Lepidopterella palustris CBS 459.81 TaxID=1314670 RepID=A0A8E2JBR0_9PEZI|nr:hypothetical protein K432DRAFT_462387 [Lepidopterella palustris CBS 459.81]